MLPEDGNRDLAQPTPGQASEDADGTEAESKAEQSHRALQVLLQEPTNKDLWDKLRTAIRLDYREKNLPLASFLYDVVEQVLSRIMRSQDSVLVADCQTQLTALLKVSLALASMSDLQISDDLSVKTGRLINKLARSSLDENSLALISTLLPLSRADTVMAKILEIYNVAIQDHMSPEKFEQFLNGFLALLKERQREIAQHFKGEHSKEAEQAYLMLCITVADRIIELAARLDAENATRFHNTFHRLLLISEQLFQIKVEANLQHVQDDLSKKISDVRLLAQGMLARAQEAIEHSPLDVSTILFLNLAQEFYAALCGGHRLQIEYRAEHRAADRITTQQFLDHIFAPWQDSVEQSESYERGDLRDKAKGQFVDPTCMSSLDAMLRSRKYRMLFADTSPFRLYRIAFYKLQRLTVVQVAKQLTLMSRQAFLGSDFTELEQCFLTGITAGDDDAPLSYTKPTHSPEEVYTNYLMFHYLNALTYFIPYDVLSRPCKKTQTAACARWVYIMKACFDNGDLASAQAILDSLQSGALYRLSHITPNVNEKDIKAALAQIDSAECTIEQLADQVADLLMTSHDQQTGEPCVRRGGLDESAAREFVKLKVILGNVQHTLRHIREKNHQAIPPMRPVTFIIGQSVQTQQRAKDRYSELTRQLTEQAALGARPNEDKGEARSGIADVDAEHQRPAPAFERQNTFKAIVSIEQNLHDLLKLIATCREHEARFVCLSPETITPLHMQLLNMPRLPVSRDLLVTALDLMSRTLVPRPQDMTPTRVIQKHPRMFYKEFEILWWQILNLAREQLAPEEQQRLIRDFFQQRRLLAQQESLHQQDAGVELKREAPKSTAELLTGSQGTFRASSPVAAAEEEEEEEEVMVPNMEVLLGDDDDDAQQQLAKDVSDESVLIKPTLTGHGGNK